MNMCVFNNSLLFASHSARGQILKPMLHALLIPNGLTFLSVASNRRLKASAFRLIGAYVLKVGHQRINVRQDMTSSAGQELAVFGLVAELTRQAVGRIYCCRSTGSTQHWISVAASG